MVGLQPAANMSVCWNNLLHNSEVYVIVVLEAAKIERCVPPDSVSWTLILSSHLGSGDQVLQTFKQI